MIWPFRNKRNIHMFDWVNQEQVEYWELSGEKWTELDQSKEKYILNAVQYYHQVGDSDEAYKDRIGIKPMPDW